MTLEDVDRQLFFVVGCPRSGTTLTQLLIAGHSEVGIPPETGFFPIHYEKNLKELGELSDSTHFNEALDRVFGHYRIKDLGLDFTSVVKRCETRHYSWETIFLAILAEYAAINGVSRVDEKSPAHLLFLDLLSQRFPEAKFIHVIRDPRSVAASLSKVPFGTKEITEAASKWKKAIAIHSRASVSIRSSKYIAVRYEDVVASTETTLRKISGFLGIEFESNMLEHHKRDYLGFNERYMGHMSNTLRPIFTASLEAWKKDLMPAQIEILQNELAEEMAMFGYKPYPIGSK